MKNKLRPLSAEGAFDRGFLRDVKILAIDPTHRVLCLEAREQRRP
jgi:hypothetical protein